MLVRLAVGLVLFALPVASLAATPADRNVVLIILDDVGTDLIGAYGEVNPNTPPSETVPPPEHALTPSLQQLADRGVRFENAWSSPWCSATRATIMTGQLAFRNGLGNVGSLPDHTVAGTYVPLQLHLSEAPARAHRWMIG